jgi:chromosomal replication initiator protein
MDYRTPGDQGVGQDVVPAYISREETDFTPAALAASLELMIGEPLFALWFSHADSLTVENGKLVVTAGTEFELRRIQSRFAQAIGQLVRQLGKPEREVLFRVRETSVGTPLVEQGLVPSETRLPAHRTETGRPGDLPASLQPRGPHVPHPTANHQPRRPGYRLDEFAWSAESELLRTAIEQVQVAPGRFTPLLVTGPNGSGKTHLVEGLVSKFRQAGRTTRRAVVITAEQFTNSFVDGVRGSGLPVFRRNYRDLDLLAVDDIQFLAGKRATLAEFHYTVEHLVRGGKQVVLTADRPVHELCALMGEHGSRIAGGLVCQLAWPDETARLKIVHRLARERGVSLEPDAASFIAGSFPGDARKLSGAINRVLAMGGGLARPIEIQAVRLATADLCGLQDHHSTLASIEQTVCESLGVTGSDLRSTRRTRRVSSARMLAMWLSRQHTPSALSEIGDHFGGRSHSTVLAAQKRINQMLDGDELVEVSGRSCTMRDAIRSLQRKLRVS